MDGMLENTSGVDGGEGGKSIEEKGRQRKWDGPRKRNQMK